MLQAHTWEDIGLVLCCVRDPGSLVVLWTSRAGRAPKLVLDLSRQELGDAGLSARLALLGAPAGGKAPVPAAVLLGCDVAHSQQVLQAAPAPTPSQVSLVAPLLPPCSRHQLCTHALT